MSKFKTYATNITSIQLPLQHAWSQWEPLSRPSDKYFQDYDNLALLFPFLEFTDIKEWRKKIPRSYSDFPSNLSKSSRKRIIRDNDSEEGKK